MTFNVLGLVSIVVFYVLILCVGLWAARKGGKQDDQTMGESEDAMLAGRSIGTLVGIFTMTATWVGGGYINGTAEMVYDGGIIWCQAPFGYCLSLILGGLFFAEKMRTEGYVTMLDPFCYRYGERMGGLLFLPALLGEVFWSAAILSALGATLTVILDIPDMYSVIISACIAVFYTFFGGLYSVAYTDVVQLFCIFIGLWLCIPTAFFSEFYTKPLSETQAKWTGEGGLSEPKYIAQWIDYALLLIFGGIPWQVYFQRVLSSRTAASAKMLSYVAAAGCLIMAIPPVLVGMIATGTDWNATGWKNATENGTIPGDFHKLVLPLVLQYLTPPVVRFVGLGSISAAVMSSADSSILSAASMFARNIYKLSIRPNASEREIIWVMRAAIVMVGIMATAMALSITSIYELWYLCADLVYVILFPQLLLVVYMPKANTYGSLAGYIIGLLLRLLGGEPSFGIPAVIEFPYYSLDATGEHMINYFPFKSLAMMVSLITIISVSYITDMVFHRGMFPVHYDVFQCIVNIQPDMIALREPMSTAASCDTLAMSHLKVCQDANGGISNPLLKTPTSETTDLSSMVQPNSSDMAIGKRNPTIDSEERLPLQGTPPQNVNYETILRD